MLEITIPTVAITIDTINQIIGIDKHYHQKTE